MSQNQLLKISVLFFVLLIFFHKPKKYYTIIESGKLFAFPVSSKTHRPRVGGRFPRVSLYMPFLISPLGSLVGVWTVRMKAAFPPSRDYTNLKTSRCGPCWEAVREYNIILTAAKPWNQSY